MKPGLYYSEEKDLIAIIEKEYGPINTEDGPGTFANFFSYEDGLTEGIGGTEEMKRLLTGFKFIGGIL